MADSILTEIKQLLGLDAEYVDFDLDVKIHINSAFAELAQIGAAPPEGFTIADKEAIWQDLYGDEKQLEMIKTIVYFTVKLAFDPPNTSFAIKAIQDQLEKLSFRLNVLEVIFNPIVEPDVVV
jgi:hypothetical protein